MTRMGIPFSKLNGSGNDFLLIDDRGDAMRGIDRPSFVSKVCDRSRSIGADGVIVIEPSRRADFRWDFYNADGTRAEMCGNGGRCAARFAATRRISGREMTFETLAGIIHAEVKKDKVRVQLTKACGLCTNVMVPLDRVTRTGHFINTGVPHLVYLSDHLDAEDVDDVGRKTRQHEIFKPEGTNVNFMQVDSPHRLRIRTYERGVEGVTLACGTGAVAAALIAAALRKASSPMTVMTRGGDRLVVSFKREGEQFTDLHLEGKAEVVCEGMLYI